MSQFQDEIDQLQTEISQLKVKVKEAIHEGQIFEEVKKITLQIKELEKKLGTPVQEFRAGRGAKLGFVTSI